MVLWLDEAQRFLPAAAAIVDLLDRVGPLAIVGSLSPSDVEPPHAPSDPTGQVQEDAIWYARRLVDRRFPDLAC